jgi:hypothetical protein
VRAFGYTYDGSSSWSVGMEFDPQAGIKIDGRWVHIGVNGNDELSREVCKMIVAALAERWSKEHPEE